MATARARAPLTAFSSANLPWSSLGERSEGTGGRRGARVGMAGETVAMPMPEAEWMRLARPATHCCTEYIKYGSDLVYALLLPRPRQRQHQRRPLPVLAVRAQISAHAPREVAADGETEARAFARCRQ